MLLISVRVPCEESHKVLLKQETIAESKNETKTEQKVDESSTENVEITVSLNGSDIAPTTVVVSDLSTAALLNETDPNVGELEDLTLATTALDSGNNSTYNATEFAAVDGDTETTAPYLPTASADAQLLNETTPIDLSKTTTDPDNETIASEETTNTPDVTISSSDVAVKETDPDTTSTATTTESPTTPVDILCPQVEADPKYRNETFELYLEEFMKKNPLAKVYKSPGFPGPYAENLNCTLRFVNDI